MPNFSIRSNEVEIMDDLTCSGKVVEQTLEELEFINKWLGGNAVTLEVIQKHTNHNHVLEIADLGCGSGEMLRIISQLLKIKKASIKGFGFDANPTIIEYARKKSGGFSDLNFECLDILTPTFQEKKFDIILATLFLHHFSSSQLITIFKCLSNQARQKIIINDLHRHWLAYYSIKILTKFFSKSSMVKFDAPLSVLRGFTRQELIAILNAAGINDYTLKWRWAFRWQLVINASNLA